MFQNVSNFLFIKTNIYFCLIDHGTKHGSSILIRHKTMEKNWARPKINIPTVDVTEYNRPITAIKSTIGQRDRPVTSFNTHVKDDHDDRKDLVAHKEN